MTTQETLPLETDKALEAEVAAFQPTIYTGWNNEGLRADEWFPFGAWAWDVAKARKLLMKTPKVCQPMRLANFRSMLGELPTPGMSEAELNALQQALIGIHIDWPKAMSATIDLSIPVFVAPMRATVIVIDGWHRVARGLADGRKILPAILFTEEEAKKFILSRPPKPRAPTKRRTSKKARA